MKNILLLVKNYSLDFKNPWLWDDMAQAIVKKGNKVTVGLLDFSGKKKKGVFILSKDITVVSYPITSRKQLVKITQAFWGNIYLYYMIQKNSSDRFDYLFTGSIVSLFLVSLLLFKLSSKVRVRMLFLWDFFPVHHVEIGRISGALFLKFAYVLESIAVNMFDVVGLMSPKNLDFFRWYHPRFKGKSVEIPIWGADHRSANIKADEDTQYSADELHIVFGGQLEKGRGIDIIVNIAECLRENDQPVFIHVYGDGTLRELLKQEADISVGARLIYHGLVRREEYLNAIRQFDAGLVITVPGVSVPTFPSKVIDYFVSSKPVLAFVESSSDFGLIVQNEASAGFWADVASFEEMYSVLMKMLKLKSEDGGYALKSMGKNGRNYHINNMEVSVVLSKVYDAISSISNI